MTTRRQHTVPAFYLRRFCISPQCNKIVQYDKQTANNRIISIANASVVNNCYSFRDKDGCWNDAAERDIARIESQAAPLFDSIIDSPSKQLTSDNRATLAKFFVLQMKRAHVYSKYRDQELARMINDNDSLLSTLEDNKAKLARRYGPGEVARVRQEIQAGKLPENDYRAQARKASLRVMLESIDDASRRLDTMNWQILKAKHGEAFISSDLPAYVRKAETYDGDGILGLDRADLNAEFFMPLSPCRFFRASHKPVNATVNASKTRVRELNTRTVRMAHRWVFTHKVSSITSDLVVQYAGCPTPLPSLDY